MSVRPTRDSGLPHDSAPVGPPIVGPRLDIPCGNPDCGCAVTFGIRVPVYHPTIHEATGFFRGCAACTYASSMEVRDEETEDFPYEKLN